MKHRLTAALAGYLVLALITTFILEGALRIMLWIFFAGLAVKTLIHSNDPDME
jgi:hypothetical protein